MLIDYFLWFFSAVIYLTILTYQDIKSKDNLVDDRHNKFMLGLTFGLFFVIHQNIFYILGISFSAFFLWGIMKWRHLVGEADINTFLWVFYGLGLISINLFITFAVSLVIISFFYHFLQKIILKKEKYPYYIVILMSFITTILYIIFI